MNKLAFNFESGILQVLENYFRDNNFEWFLGGSNRFGYSNKDSDIDVFVRILTHAQEIILWKDLRDSGFIMDNSASEHQHYNNIVHSYKQLIHVVSILGSSKYLQSEIEHDKLERFIKKNSILKYTARDMRTRLSGGEVFRILISAMKESNFNSCSLRDLDNGTR